MPNFHQKHKTHYVLLIFFGIITLASGLIRFNLLAPDRFMSRDNASQKNKVENQKDSENSIQNEQEIKINFATSGETNKNKYENNGTVSKSPGSNNTEEATKSAGDQNSAPTIISTNNIATQDKESNTVEKKPFTLKVNANLYEADLTPDISLYEGMKEIAKQNPDFTFTGKDFGSGLGFFLESINGLANSTKEKKYWIYYINGAKAQIGVSAYHLKSGDIIEWNYEKEE